ncbi:NAD(P)-binding protein [Conidiobolus coronatus NRRL 28638]|uniref:NAD(P)-binding protein n=1 Tax=Conidiobolus coronatus (strain ATCC 28846 / CBS 209.66 / NRRL 28638) TaxID=796925 RepID=A0A137PAG7_CONC2|nr:NAD(P)-binding protein [Conidiobolus coronatus NRRL 28638]|eukprot:KXN71921.1 NAD(P)-binding protein [Conidiobolus coronatus NRRL 28638]
MANSTKVLVTGGNGYLAFRLINQLLEKQYYVVTSVRSQDPNKVAKLFDLQKKYPNQLELFTADLLTAGALDEPASKVDAIFHTATPVIMGQNDDYENNMLKPAVQGLQNVLDSALKSQTVKTILLTSSLMTVYPIPTPVRTYSEKDWNPVEKLEDNPYSFSKVKAERLFWEFIENHKDRFRGVALNPTLILGPYTDFNAEKSSPYQNNKFIEPYVTGKATSYPAGNLTIIDVRDVARAHVAALEQPQANGRYALCSASISWTQFMDALKKNFPNIKFPEQQGQDPAELRTIDCTKARTDLKFEFIPYEQTLTDTAKQFV